MMAPGWEVAGACGVVDMYIGFVVVSFCFMPWTWRKADMVAVGERLRSQSLSPRFF